MYITNKSDLINMTYFMYQICLTNKSDETIFMFRI